jgi:hypothetical protein
VCLLINDVELILDTEGTAPHLIRPCITLNFTHIHEDKPAINHLKHCLTIIIIIISGAVLSP